MNKLNSPARVYANKICRVITNELSIDAPITVISSDNLMWSVWLDVFASYEKIELIKAKEHNPKYIAFIDKQDKKGEFVPF